MDLRKRLLHALGALLCGLVLIAMAINLYSLREDIEAETSASARLARTLIAATKIDPALPPAAAAARLTAIMDGGPLRHLSISLDGADPALPADTVGKLSRLLGLPAQPAAAESIAIGDRILHLTPNPISEIDERLGDTVRLLITLLLFSGATLLVAWWSAHRALSPVRELEAGLERLARGDNDARLPAFRLHEFRRVAGAIDALAAALGESRAAQRELARQLIRLQEEERRALARELHDEMGQTLTALNATAAHLERHAGRLQASEIADCARDLRCDIRTSSRQLRSMLKSLRPHGLDAEGLASALRELAEGWQARATGIAFFLELPGALPSLSDEAALVIYRVVQEALTNVVQHSGAQQCSVRITAAEGEIRAEIADDGRGLPTGGPARRGGLLGMAERLDMVGGRLETANNGNGGLRLNIVLPTAGTGKAREETEK